MKGTGDKIMDFLLAPIAEMDELFGGSWLKWLPIAVYTALIFFPLAVGVTLGALYDIAIDAS